MSRPLAFVAFRWGVLAVEVFSEFGLWVVVVAVPFWEVVQVVELFSVISEDLDGVEDLDAAEDLDSVEDMGAEEDLDAEEEVEVVEVVVVGAEEEVDAEVVGVGADNYHYI